MGGCLESLEHTGDNERTAELSSFTSSAFVDGGAEPSWAGTAFSPTESKAVQCFSVHWCYLQKDSFSSVTGRCFQVC